LASKLIRDRVEHLFNLAPTIDQAFCQQKRPSSAVFSQSVEDVQVDFIPLVLNGSFGLPSEEGRDGTGPQAGCFGVSQPGNADRIDQEVRYSDRLQDLVKSCGACRILSIRDEKNRPFSVAAGTDLRQSLGEGIVEGGASCGIQVTEGLGKLLPVIGEVLPQNRPAGESNEENLIVLMNSTAKTLDGLHGSPDFSIHAAARVEQNPDTYWYVLILAEMRNWLQLAVFLKNE